MCWLLPMLTLCKCASELVALKSLLEPGSKGPGEKHGEKQVEEGTILQKYSAIYGTMGRFTNLFHCQGLSQEGRALLVLTMHEKDMTASKLRVCHKLRSSSSHLSDGIRKDHDSKALRFPSGITRTLGLPKGGNSYGNGVSILLGKSKHLLGRDTDYRMYSTQLPSPSEMLVGKIEALREKSRQDPKGVIYDTIKLISDPHLLVLAYDLIKSKPGNMTKGTDDTTLDGMNLKFIKDTSEMLKAGKFRFKESRRV